MDTKESQTHAALLREVKTFLGAHDFTANVATNSMAAELIKKIDRALGEPDLLDKQPTK